MRPGSRAPSRASVPTLDQISTARASVAISDRLWTQIDVLDDVTAMASEVARTGSFFNEDFSVALMDLKATQARLGDVVANYQRASDRAREQRAQEAKTAPETIVADEETVQKDQERTRQRMNEFFSASQRAQADQQQMRDFDLLNEYVSDVRSGLGEVADRMGAFEEVTKRLW